MKRTVIEEFDRHTGNLVKRTTIEESNEEELVINELDEPDAKTPPYIPTPIEPLKPYEPIWAKTPSIYEHTVSPFTAEPTFKTLSGGTISVSEYGHACLETEGQNEKETD